MEVLNSNDARRRSDDCRMRRICPVEPSLYFSLSFFLFVNRIFCDVVRVMTLSRQTQRQFLLYLSAKKPGSCVRGALSVRGKILAKETNHFLALLMRLTNI